VHILWITGKYSNYQSAWRHISQDRNLYHHRRDDLSSREEEEEECSEFKLNWLSTGLGGDVETSGFMGTELSHIWVGLSVDCLWFYSPLLDLGHFLSFLILYTVGRTPWTGDQPFARPLPTHRTTQTRNKRKQTSIPGVEFESTTPVFERPLWSALSVDYPGNIFCRGVRFARVCVCVCVCVKWLRVQDKCRYMQIFRVHVW
jgi:hypothetical protein